MIVADASAVVEYLLGMPSAEAVESELFAPGRMIHAPHLIHIEVAHVIRRYAAKGVVDVERGDRAMLDLADFPLRAYPHADLLPRIWAMRHNLTAYDATYVALAEVLDAPLLTLDARLASAAGHHARIKLVA